MEFGRVIRLALHYRFGDWGVSVCLGRGRLLGANISVVYPSSRSSSGQSTALDRRAGAGTGSTAEAEA